MIRRAPRMESRENENDIGNGVEPSSELVGGAGQARQAPVGEVRRRARERDRTQQRGTSIAGGVHGEPRTARKNRGALNRLAASFQKARPITTSWSKAGEVWVRVGQPDDLSRYATEEEFFEKLMIAMKNQRHATRPGGYYVAKTGMFAGAASIPATRPI